MTLIEVKFILRNGVIIETKCENMSIKQTYGGAFTTERKEYEND